MNLGLNLRGSFSVHTWRGYASSNIGNLGIGIHIDEMIAPISQFVKWHLCMSRGSPQNHSSVILPKVSFLQK